LHQTPNYPNLPYYTFPLALLCKSNGSPGSPCPDYITNVKVYDPLTPSSWTKFTHPVFYNRMVDTSGSSPVSRFPGGRLPMLDFCGTNGGSNVAAPGDAHSPLDVAYYPYARQLTATVTSFDPITGDAAATALASLYWPNAANFCIIKVTTATPFLVSAPFQ